MYVKRLRWVTHGQEPDMSTTAPLSIALSALTSTGACGVPPLGHVVLDDAVEDGVIVIALHAKLHKVAHGLYTAAAQDPCCLRMHATWHLANPSS